MADRSAQFIGKEFKRSFGIAKFDKEARTVELAFSSDVDLERWPGVAEKLSHEPGACDLSRLNSGGNLLFNHKIDEVRGVVESSRIDPDGKGRAVVRFSKRPAAEEDWQDVQDGILRNVSVGYRVLEVKLTSESDALDVYTVTRWQPYEISIVTVPADITVGVGRSATPHPKESIMPPESTPTAAPAASNAAPAAAPVDVVAERNQARTSERERTNAILAMGEEYNVRELASQFARDGKSVGEFQAELLKKIHERNASTVEASRKVGLSDKEVKRYSFMRALNALVNPTDKKAQANAAFELECHEAAQKTFGRSAKGLMVPVDVLQADMDPELIKAFGKRAGIIGTGNVSAPNYTPAGALVPKTVLFGSFIDLLRNRTVMMNLGTKLGGLTGDIDIPRQVSGASGYWIGEDDPASQTDVDFGLLSMRPKTVAAYAEITRRMLMNSSIDIEALTRMDIIKGLATAIDTAGWYGSGSNNQPLGLKYQNGINSQVIASPAAPTYAELVAMETSIAQDNADVDSMKYVANTKFRGYAKTALKFAGIAGPIWEPGNTVNGYGCEITNQVADNEYFFGNFADLLIAMWGGLDLTVDATTHILKGRIRIVAMQDVDIGIRRPESFCFGHA